MADIEFDYKAADSVKKELTSAYEFAVQTAGDIEVCAANLESAWSTGAAADFRAYLGRCAEMYRRLANEMQATIERLDQTAALFKEAERANCYTPAQGKEG